MPRFYYNDDRSIMDYYLYDNNRNRYATIHKASCRFCNYGKGMHSSNKITKNGRWLGPFKDKVTAEMAVHKTKKKFIRLCYICE